MSDALISRYEATVEYIGFPKDGFKPNQRFIAKISFNLNSTELTLHIPLPHEERAFQYENMITCEKEWKIIERHI